VKVAWLLAPLLFLADAQNASYQTPSELKSAETTTRTLDIATRVDSGFSVVGPGYRGCGCGGYTGM
jgi:hypothetical protein